jgi:hypothetical protein
MQRPFGVNLLTKLWITISLSQILLEKIHEYIKLVKLLVVQVIGLVEDEQCFYTFTFMKLNYEIDWHAYGSNCSMLSQKLFTLQDFPFGVTI